MLRIDLLRHGETTLGHTLRGSTDDELTELGWSQMQRTINQATDQSLSQALHWDVVFSSPLKRCQLFAENITRQFQLPLVQETNLQEMHFGDWEGISTQEIYENEPESLAQFWQQPTQFTPPNAETMQNFHTRVLIALQNIQRLMLKNDWQYALVVTHGGVIKLLKCLALNQPLDDLLKMSAELGRLNSFMLHADFSICLLEE
ncbi:histidine phosphatase family protein [Acinetobacter sp. ANC 4648]|uniref:histidine phosphatase family protein n=1 Tax=Acinetobacter sp. ANC 4648 TaxID=1977875 RepID=UPI000A32BEF5|nr:histidine phosphatase family protein [Acinetobacter sp. ANC 4648]OTG80373.1 histidine phosphatase family protein [Acinetobacter sp. ANC 4648]